MPIGKNTFAARTLDMYSVFAFDGYHVDQVGDLGAMYDYEGNPINVPVAFKSFLTAMKNDAPEKRLAMNAVNQFGQENNIAVSPVDFLYTEVWAPNESYSDLARMTSPIIPPGAITPGKRFSPPTWIITWQAARGISIHPVYY